MPDADSLANRDKPETHSGVEPLLVGAKALARMLAISEATLWRWDASGELGPTGAKKRGRRLWAIAEVKDWVNSGMPERDEWLARRSGRAR